MTFFQTHRKWIFWILAGVFVGFCTQFLFDTTRISLRDTQKAQTKEIEGLNMRLTQMNKDAQTAMDLQAQINPAETTAVLAPTDRVEFTKKIEAVANELRIKNMVYTLAPPRPYSTVRTPQNESEAQAIYSKETLDSVTISDLEISGEAPTDREVFLFLDRVRDQKSGSRNVGQGRVDFRAVEILPINTAPTAAPRVEAYNLKFQARLQWIANAALKETGEKNAGADAEVSGATKESEDQLKEGL